jgi:O-antigen/teichoic acid export membrane protein
MSDLRARVVLGASWTALQKWTARASSLVVFAALSRLLGPASIGLAALGLAVTAMVGAVTQLSLTAFLVRSENVNAEANDTVFWTGLGTSVLGVGLVAALAHPIAELMGLPGLPAILLALSLLLPLSALASVPSAILERRLAFKALAIREMYSALCAGGLGVALAVAGAGVWSLVAQALAQSVISLALVVAFSRWRPGFSFSPAVLRQLVGFGGPLLGVQLCQVLRDRGEQILLAALLGLDALGVWAIATRVLGAVADLSIAVVDVVALPLFARIRSDSSEFRRIHEVCVSSCQALLVPLLVLIAVAAPILVPGVFGDRWAAAVVPTQALCLGYAIAGLSYLNRAVFLAVGKVRTELALTSASLLLHVGVVAMVAPLGLVTLAVALAAEAVVTVAMGSWALSRHVGLHPPLSGRALSIVALGVGAAACGLVFERVSPVHRLPATMIAVLLSETLLSGGMWLVNRSLVVDLARDALQLVRPRARPRAEPQEGSPRI